MRTKDTALIEQIKKSIEKTYEESGRSPSVRQIAREVGCSYSTVSRYIFIQVDDFPSQITSPLLTNFRHRFWTKESFSFSMRAGNR